MGLKDLTDATAVLRAINEFDSLGRDAFLEKYGFGKATGYFVSVGDQQYDSKAVAGAAHGYQHGTPLTNDQFSGGDATVAARLEALGFEVTRPDRLPNWTPDERMMALDLYLRTRGTMGYGKETKQVVALSEELRSLRIFPVAIRNNPRFRNPSGVALKIHNFESIDPSHEGKGMTNLGAGDVETWDAWAHRPDELAAAVAAIRRRGESDEAAPDTGEEEEYEAVEGRILYREHRRYERDRKLVAAKKKAVLKATGELACEVCGFESSAAFGVDGVIDVHHVMPLHKIGESVTRLADLALVCPTCHRVIHAHRPFITPAELRSKRTSRPDQSSS
jgi:5-methylcytosine-specific restriction protein A